MQKLRELWKLFFTFFKIGAFTFGGGYAMISLIEDECVTKNQWMTHEEMADMLAIAESTPGPISINCATHIGYRRLGLFGAAMTTLGVVLPSFIIILLIANFFDYFLKIPLVAAAFRGIAVAVALLILRVGLKLLRKTDRRPLLVGILLASALLVLLNHILSLGVSTVYVILGAALFGLATSYLKKRETPPSEGEGREDGE
ncbi:MAG: chromate transporter [Clostridia bacterium]|nr:chromate transporter [Clostridia bacterium]